MLPSYFLVLLAAASYVYGDIGFIQPDHQMVKVGQSLSIDCKVSGYSLTDSSYCTNWIRQAKGKPLQWIGFICSSGGTGYADSLKSRFSITQDTSSNTVTLRGQNVQMEDSAVYYCVRYKRGVAFDYWGKGTSVTVTSEQPEPSKMFPLIQCNQTSDDFTIGCLARGLTGPNPSFKWTDSRGHELSNFVQYPGVLSGGSYTAVSHLKITTNDWNQGISFTCQAENANQSAAVKKPADPSVLIYTSDLHQNNITLVCEVSSPSVSIRWKVNDDKPQIDGNQTATIQKSDGGKAVHSYLTVSSAVYETSTFTCTAYRGDKMVAKPFTTSKSLPPEPPETGGLSCSDENEGVEEDELSSLWSTASSFIFLFLFSLVYSTVLTLSKIK